MYLLNNYLNYFLLKKMNKINSHLFEERKLNLDSLKNMNKCYYHYNFDIKYETLKTTIKDFQFLSQLIQLIKSYQFSDLIFITGESTCSVDSRFYFNYRKMIDFYLQVLSFEELENSVKIKYHVYKTKPICINFIIIFSLFKQDKNAKLEIEIIPPNGIIISEKIKNIIYNEFDYNFLYLSLALKLKKENLISFNSSIIQNEFFILSQISQNIKLIDYLINGRLVNINHYKKNNEMKSFDEKDNYIHLNDIYKVILSKQKEKTLLKDISFKIISIKSREDQLKINIKILYDGKDEGKENYISNSLQNVITINMTKITKNSTFVMIKYLSDLNFDINNINCIKKAMKKIMSKIEKLSNISKNKTCL